LPSPPASAQPNIFTPAQEAILGELISERFESYLRVIDDEPLTAVLRRIGERLTAHLPDTGLRIRMQLIDIPDANAFALPGGHVYVSRKLVGLTRSEDELAGVIGHELGHLVSRQATQSMTRQLREVLGVTSVGDRQDILDKFTKLMENAGRKPSVFKTESHEQAEQLEADRLGLTLVSSAGYDAKAFSSVFDRIAGTGGNTGSFFSRMFGTASPDSLRLAGRLRPRGVPSVAAGRHDGLDREPGREDPGALPSGAADSVPRSDPARPLQPGREIRAGAGRRDSVGDSAAAVRVPFQHSIGPRAIRRVHAGLSDCGAAYVGSPRGALVGRFKGGGRCLRSVLAEELLRERGLT